MEAALVLLRVLLALACVLGLIWFMGRRMGGRGRTGRGHRHAPEVTVLGRQSLGHRSGLALVAVGERTLLLGVTEHGISLLTEVEVPGDAAHPDGTGAEPADGGRGTPAEPRTEHREPLDLAALTALTEGGSAPVRTGGELVPVGGVVDRPLDGSILAPSTWRQAWNALQERTVRR